MVYLGSLAPEKVPLPKASLNFFDDFRVMDNLVPVFSRGKNDKDLAALFFLELFMG